jgi:hypothetical protein
MSLQLSHHFLDVGADFCGIGQGLDGVLGKDLVSVPSSRKPVVLREPNSLEDVEMASIP